MLHYVEVVCRILILNRFPLRDADRLKQWLRNIKRVNWIPSAASRLCSMHFVDNDFCINEGVKICHITFIKGYLVGGPVTHLNLARACQVKS